MHKSTKPSLMNIPGMKPIDTAVVDHIRKVFETTTLPKIKEDTKRNAQNVAIARKRISY